MSVQVKRRRDTAANLTSFVGAQAELLVDTTNNRVQVHDGATAGGWPAAKLAEVLTNTRSAIADANYTALASDRTIAFTSLSAARTVALPAASAFPTGTPLLVVDESGSASATKTITLARAGSDTIDGMASAVISSACGYLALQSNGADKWTIVAQAASNLPAVGIGTPIDPANPLSVFGTNALFNSSGDIRVTLNKAASANTASFLYQDGLSGRAEIGLAGDDNFHFKVSPDGASWQDALVIDKTSGQITASLGAIVSGIAINNGISGNTPGSLAPVYLSTNGEGLFGAIFDHYSGSATTATNTANLVFRDARGTPSSPSSVQSGDRIGGFGARGYGATGFAATNRANLNFIATENWTDTAQGTRFVVTVTGNGTTTTFNALCVDSTGFIGIGTLTPGCSLDVNGAIRVASFTVAALPAPGTPGRMTFASDGRMFNGTGVLEGPGAGTGGLVVDNGTAWKIVGTNQTVQG